MADIILHCSLHTLRSYLVMTYIHITCIIDLHRLMRGEIWRLITTHFVFRNPAQLMVGLIVLYSLRGFERQMGSKKFGAYLIYSLLSSTVLSVLFILILNVLIGWLSFVPSSGPFFLIYSLMIFYYCKSSRATLSINSYLFVVYTYTNCMVHSHLSHR